MRIYAEGQQGHQDSERLADVQIDANNTRVEVTRNVGLGDYPWCLTIRSTENDGSARSLRLRTRSKRDLKRTLKRALAEL